MTEEKLMAEVQEAKEYLEGLGYNVAYVGIYGSQNYGLATYGDDYMSDIDFKAVVVPTLDALVHNSKPKSTTLEYKDGQIDLKDIRIFTETLVKCNPAYIETLFTPYAIYTDDYKFIINEREQLVGEMGAFLLKACYGMILEKVKAFSHPYPTIADKVEKFGYDPKQLHHIVRLKILMYNYVKTGKFVIRNTDSDIKNLMDIKKGIFNLEEAGNIRDRNAETAKKIREDYEVEPKFNSKGRIEQYSKDLIKKKIINDIKGKRLKLKGDTIECPTCGNDVKINGSGSFVCFKCLTEINTLF